MRLLLSYLHLLDFQALGQHLRPCLMLLLLVEPLQGQLSWPVGAGWKGFDRFSDAAITIRH